MNCTTGEQHPSSLPRTHAHLFTNGSGHRDGEGPHVPSAQVLTFPLVAEELQLPLLFLIQRIAVSDLHTQNGVEEVSLVLGFLMLRPQSFLMKHTLVWFYSPGLYFNTTRLGAT